MLGISLSLWFGMTVLQSFTETNPTMNSRVIYGSIDSVFAINTFYLDDHAELVLQFTCVWFIILEQFESPSRLWRRVMKTFRQLKTAWVQQAMRNSLNISSRNNLLRV